MRIEQIELNMLLEKNDIGFCSGHAWPERETDQDPGLSKSQDGERADRDVLQEVLISNIDFEFLPSSV